MEGGFVNCDFGEKFDSELFPDTRWWKHFPKGKTG
jgi:hypothetical protein